MRFVVMVLRVQLGLLHSLHSLRKTDAGFWRGDITTFRCVPQKRQGSIGCSVGGAAQAPHYLCAHSLDRMEARYLWSMVADLYWSKIAKLSLSRNLSTH